jgi:MSHA biogenesis protein MshI
LFLGKLKKKSVKPGLVGLTIAPNSLSLAYSLPSDEGAVTLSHVETIPLDSVASAQELLRQRVKELGLEGVDTVTVLESGKYNIMHVDRPGVGSEELADAVRWKIKDYLSYPVDEAIIDTFSIPGLDEHVRAAGWIYAAVAQEREIQQLVDIVRNAGLNLVAIDIPEFCLRNLVARAPASSNQSTGLLHVMPQETLFVLLRGEIMYLTRAFEIGYGDVVPSTSPGEFDGLSLEGMPSSHENAILQIQRSLDYFDSHFGQASVSQLLVLPNDAELSGFIESLQSNTGLNADSLRISELVELSDSVDERGCNNALLAIGASLRILEGAA